MEASGTEGLPSLLVRVAGVEPTLRLSRTFAKVRFTRMNKGRTRILLKWLKSGFYDAKRRFTVRFCHVKTPTTRACGGGTG